MKKKIATVVFAALLSVSMVGCGQSDDKGQQSGEPKQEQQEPAPAPEPEPEPLDLRGSWIMKANNGSDSEFRALVEDDYITVELYGDGRSMIYWAGTYEAPTEAVDSYSWVSQNDKEVTKMSLLGSRDDTKEFKYSDGAIRCEMVIQGEKLELVMSKVEGDEAAKVVESMSPDFEVTIGDATKTTDKYDGGNVLVVSYTWTNNSDEACSFDLSVSTKAFQDGVQLDTAFVSSEDFDTMADSLDIQPGTTQQVWIAYALTSDSDVSVEVSEMWGGRSFGEKTFSVK